LVVAHFVSRGDYQNAIDLMQSIVWKGEGGETNMKNAHVANLYQGLHGREAVISRHAGKSQ
jgi:ABC-type tungstate transport system permease subunit